MAPDAVAGRALWDGYRAEAAGPAALDLTCFAARAAAWLNYAFGQIYCALDTTD
jgi:hypothetical protein